MTDTIASHSDPAVADAVHAAFPDCTKAPTSFRGDLTLEITDRRREAEVLRHVRDTCGYDLLIDRFGDDLGVDADPRFVVRTILYSITAGKRLHFKLLLDELDAEADTLIEVYRGANWFEREIWDMYGIRFRGHPDLRRILLPDRFPDFPLRKDYPMEGRGEFGAPRRALGGNAEHHDGRITVPAGLRGQPMPGARVAPAPAVRGPGATEAGAADRDASGPDVPEANSSEQGSSEPDSPEQGSSELGS